MNKDKKDKLRGYLLGFVDKDGHLHCIDNSVFEIPKRDYSYDYLLETSLEVVKAYFKTDKVELMDSDLANEKYTFVFKSGFRRFIVQASKDSNRLLLFDVLNNKNATVFIQDDGTWSQFKDEK